MDWKKNSALKKKRGCYSEVTASICIAETMGFEPMCRLPDNLISSQARYGHFDTFPYYLIRREPKEASSLSVVTAIVTHYTNLL